MDYLLTGEECEETILNHYLGVCKKEIKSDFLQLMVWTIEQGINISGKEQKMEWIIPKKSDCSVILLLKKRRIQEQSGIDEKSK